MSLYLSGKLKRLAGSPQGRELLDATYSYAVKHREDTAAREILIAMHVPPDPMPEVRDPAKAASDAALLHELEGDSAVAKIRNTGLNDRWHDPDVVRTTAIEALKWRDELDWAITHVVDPAEIKELGARARESFSDSPMVGSMNFPSFLELVQHNLNHLGPNLRVVPPPPTFGIG